MQPPLLEFAVEPAKSRGFDYSRMVEPFPMAPASTAGTAVATAAPVTTSTAAPAPTLPAVDDTCVVFLGTSAAVPSKYRNGG